eukprot:8608963-Alexandrium_andersonii.AAC.1
MWRQRQRQRQTVQAQILAASLKPVAPPQTEQTDVFGTAAVLVGLLIALCRPTRVTHIRCREVPDVAVSVPPRLQIALATHEREPMSRCKVPPQATAPRVGRKLSPQVTNRRENALHRPLERPPQEPADGRVHQAL